MRHLPMGTVTLLFTDIEGSTYLLEQLGDRYASVLMEHRGLLRAALQQWHGYEVDMQGDASFCAFTRALDAVSAAVAAQHALAAHSWPEGGVVRVRMGIHTGEPTLVSEGYYVGMDVHHAARIVSAGHGGQVLVSQTTHDLIEHHLPEGVSLRDMGEYHLKDLLRPSHLFQLVIAGLPADFPGLKTLDPSPNALPRRMAMARRIRIVVVDDQTLVREGLRKLLELEPDFEVVGIAGDGEAALTTTERLYQMGTPPDVILMDIRMPRMDGIATTKALKQHWPDVHIVILTTFDDVELIQEGLRAGALGYSLKDITAEQLAMTIHTAASGQLLLQPDIASKILAALPPTPTPTSSSMTVDVTEPLTERERKILVLVARGASNRQIAETLYLTERTVKNQLSSILSKLGVRDRTQAALKARELGLR